MSRVVSHLCYSFMVGVLSLPGCTPMMPEPVASDRVRVIGKAPAPAGWLDYCHRHQEDPACR